MNAILTRLGPMVGVVGSFILCGAAARPAEAGSNWARVIGGSAREECRSIRQTSDGGYILAGGKQGVLAAG